MDSRIQVTYIQIMTGYSMFSLVVRTLDSPAVDQSSNPGSDKILMSENLRLYTTPPFVIIMLVDKALSSN